MKSFSIIIPSFNSAAFIAAAVDSIVNADYDKSLIEVIIVDDGSTDQTFNYVENLIKPYPFIKQFRKQNGNWGSVLNYVKHNKIVKNEIVSVLDADDQYFPYIFKLVNEKIANNDLFAGAFHRFNGKRKTSKKRTYWFVFKRTISKQKQMISSQCLPLPYFFTKEIFYGLYDFREKVFFQDLVLFSQISSLAKSMVFTKKSVGLYYVNRPGSSSLIPYTYDDRFEPIFYACHQCIKNGQPEWASYLLTNRNFYKFSKKNNVKFEIEKKLDFSWIPWFFRWAYFLIYFFTQKKFFIKKSLK